ncbi:hypothetical protein CPC16_008440 [Podila verticillata]|uniref:Ricin B lectin domain-containing protein n=1 Tax=Podila verticillata NRRL 6337 TaxID=1069443 RepID=A0A086TKS9_9FUNG|nr:hypothetical protein BGZ52_006925 [Haplosporangium bisporale]KAF9211282.1 hypothetical protein BGZ59_008291 [Podila verticillata]KAF9384426.1 hypothetical protein CPC16_008440 [Podila verticillata]KFH62556.1 hypothetical protein MVEG_11949 [Podila verticillata NRRL 6337]
MLKSATFFLALSLIVLQVVVAKVIESGTYLIQDTDSGLYLGLDPIPATYPPRDVPVRLFPKGHYFVEKWNVKKTHDGALTIFAGHGSPQNYKIVSKGDYVFVSAQKAPEAWAVESAGEDNVQIKLPYQDRVFTTTHDVYSPITLQPARGLPNQRYKFIRIDREHYRNRFYNQGSW